MHVESKICSLFIPVSLAFVNWAFSLLIFNLWTICEF